MKMSESIKEISAALPKSQAEIKGAIKDATNPHFKSRYADLSSVIDACKAALNKHGISFLQAVRASDAGVVVETILLHSSGEWIGDELTLPVSKNDAQGVGSAITYGRRYGLQSLVGIPAEDDDGNAAVKARPNTATQVAVDAFEMLEPDEQKFLQGHATAIIDLYENQGDMAMYIDRQKFDTEEKLALWSLLPSHVRTAIKKQMKPELATQP